jgi:murein L,D-transpeptidase YcbB/YkuD
MNNFRIRFNKTRGNPGRGTRDHVWRVFENDKEYLFKNFSLEVDSKSEIDPSGVDWNVVCEGYLHIDRDTSTAIIRNTPAE